MKKSVLVGVLASACSLTAVGALPSHVIDFSGAFVVNEPTTLSAVTNRYPDAGAAHAIHADLTLDQNTYLRLGDKGTSSSTWSLAVGSEPGENPTITVKGGSVFLTTYRDTKGFLDDADDGSVQPSYLFATMGANGGSGGKFLVQDAPYSSYGGNNSKNPLWMEKLTVSQNARTTAETFDVLQLDGNGFADITTIVNENDKPVRILFNGGYLRKNYMNSRGESLAPATGKTIGVSGEHPLEAGAEIAVRTQTSPERGNPVAIVGAGASEDNAQYFLSKDFGDDPEAVDGAKAFFEDDEIVLRRRGENAAYPWNVGAAGAEQAVAAWDEGGTLYGKPARGTASVDALVAVTNALGKVPSPFKVISADGTATNDVVMLLGSDGVPYDTLADVLAADPLPETVRLFEVPGYTVSYNGGDSEDYLNG